MALTVLLSAASSGKTTWAISHVREEASGLIGVPRLVVPSQNQVFDCNLRLANLGGAIGVKVTTFEELAWQVLEGSGTYPVMIKENTQSFILKDLLQELELEYYCGIIDMPGFGERVLDIVRELKAGGIKPGQFIDAIHKNDLGIRLLELGKTYQAYERKLEELDLVDSNGVILLAVQELERDPGLCGDWGSLIFDGFDDLSPVQINLIRKISTIIDPVYLTLTGGESSQRSPVIHKRFLRLLGELSRDENLRIRNLDEVGSVLKDEGPLAQVRRRLFSRDKAHVISSFDELKMTAVPDREAEVRTALRWLKNLWKNKQISPGKAAIIMRSQEAYRPILTRVAGEYGMKIRIMGGYPLNENPLAASILALVEVVNSGLTGLTWRDVFDLWGSPYFCWKNIYLDLGIEYSPEKHAFNRIKLKEIAHWGTVVRGFEQWEEVFDLLLTGTADKNNVGSELRLNPVGLTENETRELWDLFTSFCRMISPGVDGNTAEEFISWLEGFLGLSEDSEHSDGVGIVDQILSNEPLIQHRDWKAARQIISIFREFVWANSLLQQGEISLNQFYTDLVGLFGKSKYQPAEIDQLSITCSDVTEARGLSYDAVALLGLSEGEFPGTIKEDPFLRDEDRQLLSEHHDLNLQPSTESAESEFFYEAICRTTKYLLLTRPRIADNGTPWQASPYWEEILRCVDHSPELETTRSKPPAGQAGSIAEYLEILADKFDYEDEIWNKAADEHPSITRTIQQASRIIALRSSRSKIHRSEYSGDLGALGERFKVQYARDHVWSSSGLETYQTCPYQYFTTRVLRLEKPEPPSEGLDSRQLGNIYHHILEKIYSEVGEGYSLDDLLQELPGAASEIFSHAPVREGFRETAWWENTKQEIISKLERSLIVLEGIEPSFRYYRAEQKFGIPRSPEPHLTVDVGGGRSFNLRGFIDRVDINPSGEVRIIDYKTGGSYSFTNQAVRNGKKLQLPLYALAAQDALGLGRVKDGFYFHVQSAQASGLRLASYRDGGNRGPSAAMERSSMMGWQAIQSIRRGQFEPKSPDSGCPEYCPASDYCWAYKPVIW